MSKKLFVIITALYECSMFSGLIIVCHFVIFGVRYNDPVWPPLVGTDRKWQGNSMGAVHAWRSFLSTIEFKTDASLLATRCLDVRGILFKHFFTPDPEKSLLASR